MTIKYFMRPNKEPYLLAEVIITTTLEVEDFFRQSFSWFSSDPFFDIMKLLSQVRFF